jgi:hypothetical protein
MNMERSEALERFELLEPRVGSGGSRRMINVLEPASLVNGLNKSNALPALVRLASRRKFIRTWQFGK